MSPHFSLAELTLSDVATRKGIDNTPDAQAAKQLRRLCYGWLEPIRAQIARPLIISSGYRSVRLSQFIGSSARSYHGFGCAADLQANSLSALDLCLIIRDMALPYDELIHEHGWCHLAISIDPYAPPRLIEKTMYRAGEDIVELPGLVPVPEGGTAP